MKTFLKTSIALVAVAILFVPSIAIAQKGAGGVVGGARLHPGTWGNQRSSPSVMRSQPMYRITAPVIVRSAPVPKAVAKAPTGDRRFSYEPSNEEIARPNSDRSGTTTVTNGSTGRAFRSYSYNPSPRYYGAPKSYSPRRSSKPAFLLPKTDPRKYRVN
jgi:hypothetical protein